MSIPYRWSTANEARSATEVVLYVSADQGHSWNKIASATPRVRSFLYQAPADGEFWFAVRTYDRYGGYEPYGPLTPEMRVVVDTVNPQLTKFEGRVEQGILRVTVAAQDAGSIDPTSLLIHAHAEGAGGWSPVTLTPSGAYGQQQNLLVSGEWRVPIGARRIELQATVADLAGNRVENRISVDVERSSQDILAMNPRQSLGPRQPLGPRQREPGAFPYASQDPGPRLEQPRVAAAPTVSKNPFDRFDAQYDAQHGNRQSQPGTALSPTTRATPFGFASAPKLLTPPTQVTTQPAPTPSTSQAWPVDPLPTQSLLAERPDRFALRDDTASRADNPFSNASLRASDPAFSRLFPSQDVGTQQAIDRHVNSTEFEFDYELTKTGQWGVAKVELWGTDDQGASWRRYAIDSDRQSPIHVSTPGEGTYGFRILVESVGGLEPSHPRPGDVPDISVRVDLKKPGVMLTRVEQGQGYLADQITIDWRLDEEHPAEKGVDLFYSNRPTGPWAPLATNLGAGSRGHVGLDGAGRYTWRLQRHLPSRLYVRIEARDLAGNVGAAVSGDPIDIQMTSPAGSLLGVRASALRGR